MSKEIQVTDEQIRTRAYYLWESDGSPHGRDQDYWHRAKRELTARNSNSQPAALERKPALMTTDAKRKTSVRTPAYV